MDPVTPAPRPGWKTVIIAKDQKPYRPLPANTNGIKVETKWRLTFAERLRVLLGGHVYLTIMTHSRPLQPVRLTTEPQYLEEEAHP